MPIYGVTIKGRKKRILVKEASQAQAVAHFASAKALTAEGMQDAIENAELVWKPGQPMPDDSPDAEVPAAEAADTADADQ